MRIIPAIDLIDGACVRLSKGDYDTKVEYYKDPLDYFQKEPSIQHFDVLFQHDGSNTIRYAPYSANSGMSFQHYGYFLNIYQTNTE